jgi:hypothetical protein
MTFLVTYLAPNNFTLIVRLANDLLWPFTLEVLLANKKLVKKSNIGVSRRNTSGVLFKKKTIGIWLHALILNLGMKLIDLLRKLFI